MIKRYTPLEYFSGLGFCETGEYVLYEDHLAEIERLSAIINRQHDDCEHLKTKLEITIPQISHDC